MIERSTKKVWSRFRLHTFLQIISELYSSGISYVNDRDQIIPTGVWLSFGSLAVLGLIALAGAVF